MKLLNWRFQYWHFNKYLIFFTGTSVMKLFASKDFALAQKSSNESAAISGQV